MFEFDLSKLTLEQKARLVHGQGQWHTNAVDNLPSIMMTDGPHGLRKQSDVNNGINDSARATCFPTACAVASSWNTDNATKMADKIAGEAIALDINIVLGPGINIKRNARCGRNFEYYSEDPLIAGKMASAFVSAMQSRNVGTSLKHFAVNSQEERRLTVDSVVDERALREIYLSAFEYVVKTANPTTIMAAYNKVNGYSCTQNKHLLKDILRDDWGYKGTVVSDWGADYDIVSAIANGCDLEMPESKDYNEHIVVEAVKSGKLSEEHLDRAAHNVAELVKRVSAYQQKSETDFELNHITARQIETDSAVLLKNDDNALPVMSQEPIIVVGELAKKVRYQGGGSSHINTPSVKSFLDVLDERNIAYTYWQGYNAGGDCTDEDLETQAIEQCKNNCKVLFFGGLTEDFEGEGYDREHLNIPYCQQQLLEKIYQVNQNIVFVAFGGAPFVMPWIDKTKALINMYLGGEAVMEACADLLFGKVSPSGRLAETWPLNESDAPSFNYFHKRVKSAEHRESIFVGYRYYNTFDVPVLFPFGYGLSYTSFEYSNLKVTPAENGYKVSVDVCNNGNCEGSEVVQLYVDNADVGVIRAKRELREFAKVKLAVGEKQTVSFTLGERAFSFFDVEKNQFVTANGTYGISICKNVNETILSQQVEVAFGCDVYGNDRVFYSDYYSTTENGFVISDTQYYRLLGRNGVEEIKTKRGQFTMLSTIEEMAEQVGTIRTIVRIIKNQFAKKFGKGTPEYRMTVSAMMEAPIGSLIAIGDIKPKYIKAIYYIGNGKVFKALGALLFGKYGYFD